MSWPRRMVALLIAVLAGLSGAARAAEPADLLIRNGLVFTGADTPPRRADVAIRGDRIVYVGPRAGKRFAPARVIEAGGRIVAPGLIDPHTHPETYIRSSDPVRRATAPWIYQGVTTLFMGGDGWGSPDIAADAAWFKTNGVGVNLVPYVGFGEVRSRVLGQAAREPTAEELGRMKGLVARAMCEGALGLSSGLFYAPQSFARTEEVIAVAREAGVRGGNYDTHQRDESSYSIGLIASVREAIRIGRDAGLPVHFAHIKALGVDVHGQAGEVIRIIETARAAGQDVTADQYPWTASGSTLEASLLPRWSVDGGRMALMARLAEPATRERIRTEARENLRRRGGAKAILVTAGPLSGQTLEAIARERALEPVEAALQVMAERPGDTAIASFNMAEPDIAAFMRVAWVVTGSDGSDGHPRQFATFPLKYAKYVKAERVIDLATFIRSSTGRTADMFRLPQRGYLREGYFADVVVFDPDRYAPQADYARPRELSAGVDAVVVNGRLVMEAGRLTGERPGRVLLRRPARGCR